MDFLLWKIRPLEDKYRPLEDKTRFLQQFFRFRGGGRSASPPHSDATNFMLRPRLRADLLRFTERRSVNSSKSAISLGRNIKFSTSQSFQMFWQKHLCMQIFLCVEITINIGPMCLF